MSLCCYCKERNAQSKFAGFTHRVISCTVNSQGQHHSFDDKPSQVWYSESGYTGKRWDLNGVIHRSNKKPTVTHSTGYKGWHHYGQSTKRIFGKKT